MDKNYFNGKTFTFQQTNYVYHMLPVLLYKSIDYPEVGYITTVDRQHEAWFGLDELPGRFRCPQTAQQCLDMLCQRIL